MLGSKVFEGIITEQQLQNLPDRYISRVVANSSGVEDGDVFVCLKGGRFNGRDYVAEALERGASYIVCEEDLGINNQVVVEDSRTAFSLLCKNLSEKACEKLNLKTIALAGGVSASSYIRKKFQELDNVIKSRLIPYIINDISKVEYNAQKIHIEDIIKLCNNNVGNKYLVPDKKIKILLKNHQIFFTINN